MNPLDRLEKLAQWLIEGSFQRLFHKRLYYPDLARQLVIAAEQDSRHRAGSRLAPNDYQIVLNPADYQTLVDPTGDTVVLSYLHSYLTRLIEESNYRLHSPLRLLLDKNEAVRRGHIAIKTEYVPGLRSDEAIKAVGGRPSTKPLLVKSAVRDAERWSLLQAAQPQIRLGEPVVTLGQALDNDVILDDPSVASYHAQLRWRQGGYYLYPANLLIEALDGSLAGRQMRPEPTLALNGKPVKQPEPLAPNDTISLGNIALTVRVKADRSEAR